MSDLGIRINLNNGGISQIQNWEFNSVGYIEREYIALNSSGVFILCGETDNGTLIKSTIISPLGNCSIQQHKRIRKIYLTYKAGSNFTITCTNENNNSFSCDVLVSQNNEIIKTITLGGHRKYSGTNWAFSIVHEATEYFCLDYLGVLFIPLTRSRANAII